MENKNDNQNKSIGVSDMLHAVKLDILENISKAQKLGYITANMMDITTEKKLLDINGDLKSLLNIRSQWQARVEILEQITASREADMPADMQPIDYNIVKPPCNGHQNCGCYSAAVIDRLSGENNNLIKANGNLTKEKDELFNAFKKLLLFTRASIMTIDAVEDVTKSTVLKEMVDEYDMNEIEYRKALGNAEQNITNNISNNMPDDGGD